MNNTLTQTLNDICTKCHLENYRTTLKQILQEIYSKDIVVGLVDRQTSTVKSKAQLGDKGRIFLAILDREEPLDNIWCLLRCYGHLMNKEIDLSRKKDMPYMLDREQFAVDFARDQLMKIPELRTHFDSFEIYKEKALGQYI